MKVVFLDRDGVINEFPGNGKYVTRVKDFHFIPGAREAIRNLTEAGYTVFIASNQAGVGKGIFTQKKLDQITAHMLKGIERSGGKIRQVYYSVSPDRSCQYRKPNIGSVKEGLKVLKKNLRHASKAFFVGDTEVDIQAGYNAGCQTIFVLSGREDRRKMRQWKVKPDFITKNLLEAGRLIIQQNSK